MKEIEEKVRLLVEPDILKFGYEIHDIQYLKDGSNWILRFFVDNLARNINLDQCGEVSQQIGNILDEHENFITNPYSLEVSSPGLDRLLKKEADFVWALNKTLKVKYTNEENKTETVEAKLEKVENGLIDLRFDKNKTLQIKIDTISSARRVMIFSEIMPKESKEVKENNT
ncbi:MAG: ribosome maturation factor RimP [Candidatus Sericytochromatia bacterium]|nr:ribosome maturation factor RimP [Candidatus Sericytochromatia bacterium]